MTRQEAFKKITNDKCYSDDAANRFLDNIEALGLIKFDKDNKNEKTAKQILASYMTDTDDCIKELELVGYRIVKIGKETRVLMFGSSYWTGFLKDIQQEQS